MKRYVTSNGNSKQEGYKGVKGFLNFIGDCIYYPIDKALYAYFKKMDLDSIEFDWVGRPTVKKNWSLDKKQQVEEEPRDPLANFYDRQSIDYDGKVPEINHASALLENGQGKTFSYAQFKRSYHWADSGKLGKNVLFTSGSLNDSRYVSTNDDNFRITFDSRNRTDISKVSESIEYLHSMHKSKNGREDSFNIEFKPMIANKTGLISGVGAVVNIVNSDNSQERVFVTSDGSVYQREGNILTNTSTWYHSSNGIAEMLKMDEIETVPTFPDEKFAKMFIGFEPQLEMRLCESIKRLDDIEKMKFEDAIRNVKKMEKEGYSSQNIGKMIGFLAQGKYSPKFVANTYGVFQRDMHYLNDLQAIAKYHNNWDKSSTSFPEREVDKIVRDNVFTYTLPEKFRKHADVCNPLKTLIIPLYIEKNHIPTIIKQNRGLARNILYNDIISYVKPKLAKGETPSQVFRAVKKTKLGSKVQQLLTINGLDTGNAEGNGYNLIDLFKSFGTRFTFPDKPTVKSDSKR